MTRGLRKRWLLHGLAFLFGLGIVVLLVAHAGFARFFEILRRGRPLWVGAAFLVYGGAWIFRTARMRRLAAFSGRRLGWLEIFRLQVAGFALNTLLPAKMGDVATMGFLKLKGLPFPRAAAVVFQTRVLDLLLLVLLALPALTAARPGGVPGWVMAPLLLGFLAVGSIFVFVTVDRSRRLERVLGRWRERAVRRWPRLLLQKLADFYGGYHDILKERRLLGISAAHSLGIWVFEGFTAWLLARAVGADPGMTVLWLALAMANIGKSAPVTPGGIGIYESMFAAVLVLTGMPFDLSITLAILDHAVKKVFNLCFGLPSVAMLGLNLRQIYDMSQGTFEPGRDPS